MAHRRSTARLRLSLLAMAWCLAIASPAFAAQSNVLFILDGSGSMWGQVDGKPKIVTAKAVLDDAVQRLPAGTAMGLMTYGVRRKGDCSDIQILSPVGSEDASAIEKKVNALTPKGDTPIAATLQRVPDAFKGRTGEKFVVFVTDGAEECRGDPCAAAKALAASDIDVRINLVGFNLGKKEHDAVQCIVDSGRGKYYDARDTKGLTDAMTQVQAQVVAAAAAAPAPVAPPPPAPVVKQGEHLYGTPIHGGDAFDSAVALKTGTLYHLDYDQSADKQDFFKVPMKGGQRLLLTLTGGNTDAIQAEIENSQRQRVAGQIGAGTRARSTLFADVANGGDGVLNVLIESAGYGGHVGPDATFQVDLINQFDANTNRDAGADENSALALAPGSYPHNNMNDVDTVDVYKLTLAPGKPYTIKARPADSGAQVHFDAEDSDGVHLGTADPPNQGAVTTLANLKLAKGGIVFVKVTFNRSYGMPAGNYALAFGQGDVASPPKPSP
jgi:hypothetical protein